MSTPSDKSLKSLCYIAQRMLPWSNLMRQGKPVDIGIPPGCLGFLLVFDTEEHAKAFLGEGVTVKPVIRQGHPKTAYRGQEHD